MALEFGWDPAKAEANWKKHGVSFKEAASIFSDPLSRLLEDPDHSMSKLRYIMFGRSHSGRLLAVSHTDRGTTIRIISARQMTSSERRQYARFQP